MNYNSKILATLIAMFTFIISTGVSYAEESDADQASEVREANKGTHSDRKSSKRNKRSKIRIGDQFNKLDINEDGSVDLNEYLGNAEQRFNDMDFNGDQLVTTEEAREARKLMRIKMKELLKERRELKRAEKADASEDSE